MVEADFFGITINVFLKLSGKIPFNVYINIGHGKYVQIFKINETLDHSRVDMYVQKGVKKLVVPKADRHQYINTIENLVTSLASRSDLSSDDAALIMEELAEQTLLGIYQDETLDVTYVRRAEGIVRSYIGLLQSDKKTVFRFLELCREETYFVRHSISTSIFSILIAQAAGQTNSRSLQIVGLGGLLHDIGMSKLDHEIDSHERALTHEEWLGVKQHTVRGRQIAIQIPDLPAEIIQIIEQHHECHDGSGYPNGMKSEWIYYPARVVALADAFSALTTKRGGRARLEPRAAIELLLKDRKKYDPSILNALISLLGFGQTQKTG